MSEPFNGLEHNTYGDWDDLTDEQLDQMEITRDIANWAKEHGISISMYVPDISETIAIPDCGVCKLRTGGYTCQKYGPIPARIIDELQDCPDLVENKSSFQYEEYLAVKGNREEVRQRSSKRKNIT